MPRQNPLYSWYTVPSACVPPPPVVVSTMAFPEIADDLGTGYALAPMHGETSTLMSGPPTEFILDDDWSPYLSAFPEIANDLTA